jgi:signal transduction histidine kinase
MAEEPTASLKEQLQRRESELAAIRRITIALHARTKPEELVRQTLDAAVETVDAAAGSILLHEPKSNKLVFKYVIGKDAARLTGVELDAGQGIVGRVFGAGAGEITQDTSQDTSFFRGIDELTGQSTRNMVTVPLMTTEGRAIGAMQVLNKRQGIFEEQDLHLLEVLSAQAASAIETAQLHEDAKLAEVIHLIGDISHDIKNMVTPVVTGAQTLEFMVDQMWEELDAALDKDGAPSELAARVRGAVQGVREFFPEVMEMTLEGTSATQERVREIADAVKGIMTEPHFESANVNEIVELVAKALKLYADRGGVTLDLTGLGEAPQADLDRKRMYNALYNLISNAIPETPRGGRVSVRTEGLDADEDGAPDALKIVIADTGRGMPEHVKRRLFDDPISTKPGGTGLGMRIVKKVIDAHGGQITVASEEGRGTTFTILLPLQQAAASTSREPRAMT